MRVRVRVVPAFIVGDIKPQNFVVVKLEATARFERAYGRFAVSRLVARPSGYFFDSTPNRICQICPILLEIEQNLLVPIGQRESLANVLPKCDLFIRPLEFFLHKENHYFLVADTGFEPVT